MRAISRVEMKTALRLSMIALALGAAAPAAGQTQRAAEAERTILRGTVVDWLSGTPLPNATVRLVEARRGVLTDSLGRFGFVDVPVGRHTIEVHQYGYEAIGAVIDVAVGLEPLEIELDPGPVALEGFTVIADRLELMNQRFESRRNAAPVSVQALDQKRLQRSPARNVAEMLRDEAFLEPVPCAAFGGGAGACIWRRGRPSRPTVYIDEAPAGGGYDVLAMYSPADLYLVEVYSAGGEIRAYTHNFMERMARKPMALIPINLWFGR